MPYNTSKAAARRMLAYLQTLRENQGMDVRFTTNDPVRLCYKLREAFAAVEAHRKDFAAFRDLKDYYQFKPNLDHGVVLCRWMGERPVGDGIVVDSLASMQVNEAKNALEIVGAALKFTNAADEIYFPNGVLNDSDKEKLYRWTKSSSAAGWQYIDQDEAGTTLTRKEVEPSLLWSPPELDINQIYTYDPAAPRE